MKPRKPVEKHHKPTTLALRPDQLEKLDKYQNACGETRSKIVRQILDRTLGAIPSELIEYLQFEDLPDTTTDRDILLALLDFAGAALKVCAADGLLTAPERKKIYTALAERRISEITQLASGLHAIAETYIKDTLERVDRVTKESKIDVEKPATEKQIIALLAQLVDRDIKTPGESLFERANYGDLDDLRYHILDRYFEGNQSRLKPDFQIVSN